MEEKPLKDIVKKVISSIGNREKSEADFLKTWERAVGKKASKHTKPAFLKTKRLVVNVSDSTWLYWLTLRKEKILIRINKDREGKRRIKELQFRIGTI